ncbi:MAG: glutamate-1-semialdehyde-2,1-aminomutase [Planctomycetes bacterium RBG_16_43_13]|nr:MAG: glutamate-1-semialdehyde-2,1-aminomutase [Planctomycetes bacterium RBG_16_43_13]
MKNNLFLEAKKYLAGGVNSPVRAFKGIGRHPIFVKKAKGKYLFGEDGKKYLDFCLSWGPLILGHAHPAVAEAVKRAVDKGTSFGAPTSIETEFARLICKTVPSIERIRFVNSGTEAVMSAIRLARGFTGKKKILKFDGCYHGHLDCLLAKAGSGVSSLPDSSSLGVSTDTIRHTISVPFNDMDILEKNIKRCRNDLAAVIVEPVAGNMGVVLPQKAYLKSLREITKQYKILLIFDEVITGFRVSLGGAQEYYKVIPDLTILGKIIGGGFPVGAFGGKKEIMDILAPDGGVYQAGTLSGNPIALTAGLTTVRYLIEHKNIYQQMDNIVSQFAHAWKIKSNLALNHIGSMFTIFYTKSPVANYSDALIQDSDLFKKQYKRYLDAGIYLPPSMFETAFISIRHTINDMERLLP